MDLRDLTEKENEMLDKVCAAIFTFLALPEDGGDASKWTKEERSTIGMVGVSLILSAIL